MNNKKNYIFLLSFFFFLNSKDGDLFEIIKLNNLKFDKTFQLSKTFFQEDGSLILYGINNLNKLELLKLDSNYQIDTTFGNNGKVLINNFETNKLELNDIVSIQEDGLIISGISYFNNQTKAIIFKINKNGILEFISIIPINNLTKTNIAYSKKNNKIFLILLSNNLSIMQLNRYGEIEPKFKPIIYKNVNNYQINQNNKDEFFIIRSKKNNIEIIKFNENFKVANQFGKYNRFLVPISDSTNVKLIKQSTKDIIIGYNQKNYHYLIRIKNNGKIDKNFTYKNLGILEDLIVQHNDKILIFAKQNYNFHIVRLLKNGQIDETFAKDGLLNVNSIEYPNLKIQKYRTLFLFYKKLKNYFINKYHNDLNFISLTTDFKKNRTGLEFIQGKAKPDSNIIVKLDDKIILNTKLIPQDIQSTDVDWKVNCPKLEPGDHFLEIESIDSLCNVTRNVKKFKILPKIELNNKFINLNTKDLTGISDPHAQLLLVVDNKEEYTTQADENGNWQIKLPKLIDGEHILKLYLLNDNNFSKEYKIFVKTTLPELKIENISNNSNLNNQLKIFWVTGEIGSTINVNITSKIDKQNKYQKETQITKNKRLSFNISDLKKDIYELEVIQTDFAGNIVKQVLNFTVS